MAVLKLCLMILHALLLLFFTLVVLFVFVFFFPSISVLSRRISEDMRGVAIMKARVPLFISLGLRNYLQLE